MFKRVTKKKPISTPERRSRVPQPVVRSGTVFSYHASRSVREDNSARNVGDHQQPEKARRSPGRSWKKRVSAIGLLLAFALVCVFCLQLSSQVKVEIVGPAGARVILRDRSVYEKAAQQAFKTFFNSNKLTVNTEKIVLDLKRQFPELKAISVKLPMIGNTPVVYIQPTTPQLVLVSANGVYLLDSDGRVLLAGNQVAALDKLPIPIVNDKSDLVVSPGQIALPRKTMSFINEVYGQLSAKKIAITSAVLPAGTHELHLRVQGAGYYVKFNLHGSAREEAGRYMAVKTYLDNERKSPREYIDVRVENKAYYR